MFYSEELFLRSNSERPRKAGNQSKGKRSVRFFFALSVTVCLGDGFNSIVLRERRTFHLHSLGWQTRVNRRPRVCVWVGTCCQPDLFIAACRPYVAHDRPKAAWWMTAWRLSVWNHPRTSSLYAVDHVINPITLNDPVEPRGQVCVSQL